MIGEVNLYCGGFQFVNAISRPLAANIVVHFLGGFHFQATFLIRNHSNVHCVEVDLKAALKYDKTFYVYHLDTIQVHNVQKPFKWTLCGSRFEGSFKLKSQPPDQFRDKLTPW